MNPWDVRPESRHRGQVRGGRSGRARAASGYTRIRPLDHAWWVGWRWKHETRWHAGSVATREEAEDLRDAIREALTNGEVPDELPVYDASEACVGVPRDAAASKAATEMAMARLERCARCGLIEPCAPCLPELENEMRSARRGT